VIRPIQPGYGLRSRREANLDSKPWTLFSLPRRSLGVDHDDFGLNQSKVINVIDFKSLEPDATENRHGLFLIPLSREAFLLTMPI
jgi:hypothetical protein